jgi:hypothetical protein
MPVQESEDVVRRSVAIASVVLLCLPTLLFAQTIEPDVPGLEMQLAQAKETIVQWESLAFWGRLLGLALVVMGGTVTALQPFGSKRWCAVSVAVIGVAISALSFLRDDADASYKTYRHNAEAAKEQVKEAEGLLTRLKKETTEDRRAFAAIQVAAKLDTVKELKAKLGGTAIATLDPLFIATAFAQSTQRPAWTGQAKIEDTTSFRFVGIGADRSLTAAQAKALEDAQQNAARQLSISLDSAKLYARPAASFTEWDAGQGVYRQYTQVQLNRALIRK